MHSLDGMAGCGSLDGMAGWGFLGGDLHSLRVGTRQARVGEVPSARELACKAARYLAAGSK